jgi:alkanesulfonate monooxygenase SsuD/methylene tetrahydromethanopterin reductase-like flavin-dependent oxidoreductase (luciferase family)
VLECWTVLTALATQTTTVRLGPLVLGNTYRHPAVLANMAATLGLISSDRLVLGLGAGWQSNEHAAYGIELPAPGDRIAALDEACAVIRGLLDQSRSTLAGSYYQLRDAPCDPKPEARVPLLIGGEGPRLMRVAARHADIWHSWADPDEFARKNELLDQLCVDAGRRPGDLARANGGEVPAAPAEALELLRAFENAGAAEFIVSDDARVPFDQSLAQIDLLTREVRPAFWR